ncbi:sugar O-acetyltransferase [Vibrio cholerae]|nr:sugar O-acetyltransferase [Vibrio cholerae]
MHFEPTFRCEFGQDLEIGDDFYAHFDCIKLDTGGIPIGHQMLFGPRVGIYAAIHTSERATGACYVKSVSISDRAWVGAGFHINGGISMGQDSIIASGSVVTKNIPAGVISAGIPARPIREITEKDRTGF